MPLTGYKVLDLTQARAGPTSVRLLADWGATVIRIKPPSTLDAAQAEEAEGEVGQEDPDTQNLHRNKRGLALNLKSDEGRKVFMELARQCDVVVENFRADVKHRLGVDYDAVAKVNPRIIYASISGFGQTGPYSGRPGVDQITQGTSGLMSVTGEPGRGPLRVGIAISDTSAGMFLGQGILLALVHRERTGEGQWVHTSLLESMLSKLDFQGARYTMDAEVPAQQGNFHPTNAPMGLFDAADGPVNVSASSNRGLAAMCEALGAENLVEDPRFESEDKRIENRAEVNAAVNQITRRFEVAVLVEKLNAVRVPCGPVYDIGEAFEDEQVKHLKMVCPAPHPRRGEINLVRSPINLSKFPHPAAFHHCGPRPGEHSDEILREFGFQADDIRKLYDDGVVT